MKCLVDPYQWFYLVGLPYLRLRGVYTDSFILHDESADDLKESKNYGDHDTKSVKGPTAELV